MRHNEVEGGRTEETLTLPAPVSGCYSVPVRERADGPAGREREREGGTAERERERPAENMAAQDRQHARKCTAKNAGKGAEGHNKKEANHETTRK